MHRLDRRLQLEPPGRIRPRRFGQMLQPLVHHGRNPAGRVLLGQRHEAAGRIPPGRVARGGQEHQRQQPPCLRRIRQLCHQQPGQEHRLGHQSKPPPIGPILPPGGIRRIDRFQHRPQPLRHHVGLGQLEADAGRPDLRLGAGQALAHGGRVDQEGGGDPGRIQPQHALQHQGRMHRRIDRRMRTNEQQRQPLVREFGLCPGVRQFQQGTGRLRPHPAMARGVGQPVARRGQQPRLRPVRYAVAWPSLQRGGKGIGQRILRRRHIARPGREPGQQPPIGGPGDQLDGVTCRQAGAPRWRHRPPPGSAPPSQGRCPDRALQ